MNQKMTSALWIKYFILTGWALLQSKCLCLLKLLKQTRMDNNGATRKKTINYKTNIQKFFSLVSIFFSLN